MKKLFKVTLVAILGISLAACGEAENSNSNGFQPQGEQIGSYHFEGNISKDLNAKVIQDEDGCIFMVTEKASGVGAARIYGLDVEFMGGCDFPALYNKK